MTGTIANTQAEDTKPLWRRYTVDIRFIEGIAGGLPAADLVDQHMRLFSHGASNPMKLSIKTDGEVTEAAMKEYLQRCSTLFPADDIGLYIRGFQFNAMLKDAGQRSKETMKAKGLGNMLRDGGLHFPHRIYMQDGAIMVERPSKPDNGPSNIKRFQVIERPRMVVECAVLNNDDLPDARFRLLWEVAQGVGLGAQRHLGYGAFRVMSLTEIPHNPTWSVAELLESKTQAGVVTSNGSKTTEASAPAKVIARAK